MNEKYVEKKHRAATSLELFYDLVIVIAMAFCVEGFHHSVINNHILNGSASFAMIFGSVCWAWMNFTWFSSYYDTDDFLYKIGVLGQLAGTLVIASGIKKVYENNDFSIILLGFTLMRFFLSIMLIRIIKTTPSARKHATKYCVGMIICQIGWSYLVIALSSTSLFVPGFLFLFTLELCVPFYSSYKTKIITHKGHLIERYGLLTIIVLGEAMLACAHMIKALSEDFSSSVFILLLCSLVILFSIWWIYFDEKDHPSFSNSNMKFFWGYSHYLIFGGIALVGGGLSILLDFYLGKSSVSLIQSQLCVSIPLGIFLFSYWSVHLSWKYSSLRSYIMFPVGALFIALLGAAYNGLILITIMMLIYAYANSKAIKKRLRKKRA